MNWPWGSERKLIRPDACRNSSSRGNSLKTCFMLLNQSLFFDLRPFFIILVSTPIDQVFTIIINNGHLVCVWVSGCKKCFSEKSCECTIWVIPNKFDMKFEAESAFLTLSCRMFENDGTYFKNLVIWAPQDF